MVVNSSVPNQPSALISNKYKRPKRQVTHESCATLETKPHVKLAVPSVVTSCSLDEVYRRFRETCFIHQDIYIYIYIYIYIQGRFSRTRGQFNRPYGMTSHTGQKALHNHENSKSQILPSCRISYLSLNSTSTKERTWQHT